MSDKMYFKSENSNKKHKRSLYNNTTIIYGPNTGAYKYSKQIPTYIKGEIDGNTIRVGYFILLFTQLLDRPDRKITKQILDLYHTLKQIDLTDINRIFNQTAAECTFFSRALRTFLG